MKIKPLLTILFTLLIVLSFQNCMKQYDTSRFNFQETSHQSSNQSLGSSDLFVYPYQADMEYFEDLKVVSIDTSTNEISLVFAVAQADHPDAEIDFEIYTLNERGDLLCGAINGTTSYPDNHHISLKCNPNTGFQSLSFEIFAKLGSESAYTKIRSLNSN